MKPYIIHGPFQDDINYSKLIEFQSYTDGSLVFKITGSKKKYRMKYNSSRINKVQTKSLKMLRK